MSDTAEDSHCVVAYELQWGQVVFAKTAHGETVTALANKHSIRARHRLWCLLEVLAESGEIQDEDAFREIGDGVFGIFLKDIFLTCIRQQKPIRKWTILKLYRMDVATLKVAAAETVQMARELRIDF